MRLVGPSAFVGGRRLVNGLRDSVDALFPEPSCRASCVTAPVDWVVSPLLWRASDSSMRVVAAAVSAER